MALAQLGATDRGGVCRLALTPADRLGRAWFEQQAVSLGMTVRTDRIGNQFARLDFGRPDADPILIGSHLDTQPTGGKFDGAYGVVAGFEVVRALRSSSFTPQRPLEVVAWTNEEGSRFLPVMAGSGVWSGAHAIADVLASKDSAGELFGDALQAIGANGIDEPGGSIDSYFEAHIEQGPVLEDAAETIGVVTGALGQQWFSCELTGFEAHAGPTPMGLRRDALQGAAELISAVDAIGRSAPDARATVGSIQCWPNSRNTIPGQVAFSIDLRHSDDAGLDRMVDALRQTLVEVADRRGLEWKLTPTNHWPACHFDKECVGLVRAAAAALGLPHREMVSGAGHDAVNVARVAPTAMIFVPCLNGVSHNEIEDASASDLGAGADVLLGAVLKRLSR